MAVRRLLDPAQPLVRRVRGLAAAPRTGETLMVGLAVVVGLGTGLLAVALIRLIDLVQRLSFGPSPDVLSVLLVPALGGLLVGLLVTYAVPEAAGGGVSQVMASIALHGGRMRPVVAPGKLLATGLALGTGASGGREGPIVQIGGSLASTVGRLFALTEDQKRALIAAGVAGGTAASFNAPIGGMLFALEVIVGGFRARYLPVIVVSAVVASVTARQLVGPGLIYQPPPYSLGHPAELLLYALLGLAAVALGIAFTRGTDLSARRFARLRVWPPLRPALGGLAVGLIALAVPEVLGTGDRLPPVSGVVREPVAEILAGGFGSGYGAAAVLLLLAAAKLVATCVTIGSGSSAGPFGPALFLGAALGGAFGHAAAAVAPGVGVQPGAFALAGMAAVLAASARAPLTGILIVFELTGDYGMVLPLMLATGIATLVAERLDHASIYTLPLLRRGIVYAEPEDVDILQTVRVGEVMTTDPKTVPADLPLERLHDTFRRTRHHGFPVLDRGRLIGVVTLSDLSRAVHSGRRFVDTTDLMAEPERVRALTAADVCTRQPLTVTARDPVSRALRRMAAADVGRLPVVSAEDHSRLVGLVRRSDVVKAYQRAVNRAQAAQQRRARARLRDLTGARFVELVVDPAAPAAGRAVRDVAWPRRTILTGVRRGHELIMPNGDTTLRAGDVVTVLTDHDAEAQARRLLSGVEPDGPVAAG